MKPFLDIIQTVETYHELGETIQAAHFLLDEYQLNHSNLKGFELREKAEPKFVLMTTEGNFGEPQIIKIPENTFQFDLVLMLNLLAHEMVHVEQKSFIDKYLDKNEREWQAYYEMLFHKKYPLIPTTSTKQLHFIANKALEYYNRMEKDGELQLKYVSQKLEVEDFLRSLL
jgi:hypothetical protein